MDGCEDHEISLGGIWLRMGIFIERNTSFMNLYVLNDVLGLYLYTSNGDKKLGNVI